MPKSKQIKGLKALLDGKIRFANTTQHGSSTTMTYGAANVSCLTSNTSFSTANDTSGIITTDSDKVRIKSIRLRGSYTLQSLGAFVAVSGMTLPRVRQMVVWFYKGDQPMGSLGALPEMDEVLENISIDALEYPKNQGYGEWVVLHDQTYDFGVWQNSATSTSQTGPINHNFDITIPVNRSQSYAKPPTSTYPGGHRDSNTLQGQVTRGFPILYQYLEGAVISYEQPVLMTINSRVLYSE